MANLSKSKILAFRQCPKRLWLELHRPELNVISAATRAKFRVGHEVGEIARRIYDPAGTGVTIDARRDGYPAAFAQTEELLTKGERPVFEAGLQLEGAIAFADVMLPAGNGRTGEWRMIEVKSSASVKDYQKDDIAVQSHIAAGSGVRLSSISLACIDSKWVYPGGGDYRGLLFETDLTNETLARDREAAGWISEAQKIAASSAEPDIRTGSHCSEPYECGFCSYCKSQEPQPEFPLDWLPRFSVKQRASLGAAAGDDLRLVPDELLNEKQLIVKQHTLASTTFFDAEGAAADLATHGFPALFLDFESVNPAVPLWKGTRPFQAIAFQFSLHKVAADGRLTHMGFLDLTGDNPVPAIASALLSACGGSGPIFVYSHFEKTRIQELAKEFPPAATALLALIPRLIDMLPIAKERYYHPSMKGSWGIKAVLPAVAPDLAYGALAGVQEGGSAMEAYLEALRPGTPPERIAEIRSQLAAYCRLDTFAMVRLWHFFSGRGGPTPVDMP